MAADGADNTYEDRRDDSFVGGQRTLCPHNIDEGLPDACIWGEGVSASACRRTDGQHGDLAHTFVLFVGGSTGAESGADEVQWVGGDDGRNARTCARTQKSKWSRILLHLQQLQPQRRNRRRTNDQQRDTEE